MELATSCCLRKTLFLQVQLLDLVGQFYASLLHKDDRILAASGEEEDDQVFSLPVCLASRASTTVSLFVYYRSLSSSL